ncbi:MAG: hypothetical protein R8K53_00545 [Mariprofundaceae bacterium]
MLENLLPGGLASEHGLHRNFTFSPLTGEVELILAECANSEHMPDAVTQCLSAALDDIGGQQADANRVAALSVGDRQHLMRHLQILLHGDAVWYSATCTQCHADFDFQLELSQLPVKTAGQGYPFAEVATSAGLCRFRIPTGRDQSALSGFADEEQACVELLHRCLLCVDGEKAAEGIVFSTDDREAIESALEEIAPDIGCEISVCCLACKTENRVALNPYACIGKSGQQIIPEVHKLAWYYHWGEAEILAMPSQRRQHYLNMIDAARGIGDGSPGGG